MPSDLPKKPQSPEIIKVQTDAVPVLPLRDVVVYPHMVIPLFVGRERSIQALDKAMQDGKQIVLVAQTQADIDEPGVDDLYHLGTLATILQLLKLPDGTVKVLVEGGEALDRETIAILKALSKGPFIFNLGHGVLQQTPPEHVARVAELVLGWPATARDVS